MDYIERRIVEISKLNEEALKEENKDDDNKKFNKANINLLERVQSKIDIYIFFKEFLIIKLSFLGNIFSDDNIKSSLNDPKKFSNGTIHLKDIRENAMELINTYIKKYDKAN